MDWQFPVGREEKREALLQAVEKVRDVVEAGVEEGERIATLPPAVVDALYDSGLFALKLPLELGGAEADLLTQMEVIEAISRIDGSAGWCSMIGSSAISVPGAYLSDQAIAEIFSDDQVPKAAGAFLPQGEAVSVDGGYLVTGRWGFASGIRHAQWVSAATIVVREGHRTGEYRSMVIPTSSTQIHDNWQVAGLKATGSCDFSVSEVFVPEHFSYERMGRDPYRGGPLFRLGFVGFVAYEHAAFALGVARRALDAIIEQANTKRRGMEPSSLSSRVSFQRSVGECDLRLRAARALVVEILERAWELACQGTVPGPQLQSEMRSSAAYATQVALDVATQAFRYGGGSVLYLSSVLQRCLRDLNAAAQHIMVSDSALENHGQFALGFPNPDAMG